MSSSVILPDDVQVFQRGWLSSNNVLLRSEEATALIDSGYHSHAQQTVALITDALGTRPLDFLLNTHLHSDHCGGNAALQAHFPALQTLIPPGQSEQVRNWDASLLSYEPTGQTCSRFKFQDLLLPGHEFRLGERHWQIHAAAGHDPHSIILFEPSDRILISADALWENGFGVVFPEIEGESAFNEVESTLDLIEALSPRLIIPGHGPVFSHVEAALQRARQRLSIFSTDPVRHASYAAKVLIKFKLLELQSTPRASLMLWCAQTSYLSTLHQTYFPSLSFNDWLHLVVQDLSRAGAIRLTDELIMNH